MTAKGSRGVFNGGGPFAEVQPKRLAAPQPGMAVLIRRRVRNDEYAEEEVVWPKGWPLPAEGSILLGHSVSGRVEHVEFDLPNARILVIVRA